MTAPPPPGSTTGPDRASAGDRPGVRRVGLAVAAAAVLGSLVWLFSAGAGGAVVTSDGVGTVAPFVAGQPVHVGQAGMVDEDIVVLWARPRVVGSAQVDLRVCRRGGGPVGGAIGSINGDAEIQKLCPELEPLRRGLRLAAEVPQGDSFDYVLVSLVSSTPDEPVFYCGLDLVYRTGSRLGFARKAGTTHAVISPEGRDPFGPFPTEQEDPC